MTNNYEYSSMRQIGPRFGVSSHDIGKWLKEDCDLRTPNGKPSRTAFEGGYVKRAATPHNPDGYFYVWHTAKTIRALEAAGHQQVKTDKASPSAPKLVGPFEAAPGSNNGFEIVDANGNVGIWVYGNENAEPVVKLLNLASRNGVFF